MEVHRSRLDRRPGSYPVTLRTADGAAIAGDVAPAVPGAVRGVAVLCHPHPANGGDRFHPLIDALFTTLPDDGWVAVRFDFRLPADPDGGRVASADLGAAIDHAAGLSCETEATGQVDGPAELVVVGYSYGAVAALRSVDPRPTAIVAIAPPLAAMPVDAPPTAPTLLLTPQHDQFTSPAATDELTDSWPAVRRTTIPAADHFLLGHVAPVVRAVTDWLSARSRSAAPPT